MFASFTILFTILASINASIASPQKYDTKVSTDILPQVSSSQTQSEIFERNQFRTSNMNTGT